MLSEKFQWCLGSYAVILSHDQKAEIPWDSTALAQVTLHDSRSTRKVRSSDNTRISLVFLHV